MIHTLRERSITLTNAWEYLPFNGHIKTAEQQQYSNMVIGTLAVDGWLLHSVQRGGAWAGCGPAQSPPRCTKCQSPPINGQCDDFILFAVAL